jgi:rhamnogalacturonyl hydrolase YesR
MLIAGRLTNDQHFIDYAMDRMRIIYKLYHHHRERGNAESIVDPLLHPSSLDDSGAMCAAFIMASQAGIDIDLTPLIEHLITFISKHQFRLPDGTFARNRPYPNTLWLDDLFMSVSALSRIGSMTGDETYLEDCVKQVLQFSERMFIKEKGIYRHGWVQEMQEKPSYYWGRANGWALLAKTELLSALPGGSPGYSEVMDLLKSHIRGLVGYQSGSGLWHQIIDRNDTYLETSASALFVYGMARAVNEGWIDPAAYGPIALLGWNGLETRINDRGEVEGTCVGTGMGFDIAFYTHRPVNIYAAHGYGPMFLAASEIIRLLRKFNFVMVENAIQVSL